MIKNYDTSLDVKLGTGSNNKFLDVKYEEVPDGDYQAVLAKVYKWRPVTKDTYVNVRDENDKLVKGADGANVKELVKDLTWNNADIVLAIVGGDYDGRAIKGSLSTHPNMRGGLSNFLYSAGLYGIPVGKVVDHIGVRVTVHVKNKTRTYEDKETGLEMTITEPTASYYSEPDDDAYDDFANGTGDDYKDDRNSLN